LTLGAIGLIGLRQTIGWREPQVLLLRVLIVIALLLTLIFPIGWWVALVLALVAEVKGRAAFYAARSDLSTWHFSPW
jgi:hypothetical protein